jgi:hypothetical protein
LRDEEDAVKGEVQRTPALAVPPNEWAELVAEGIAKFGSGWWEPESAPDEERFAWGGVSAEVNLPAFPRGSRLEIDAAPYPGPAPVELLANGKRVRKLDGDAGRERVWVAEDFLRSEGANVVTLTRSEGYIPGPRDPRKLAVQLFGVRVVGPKVPWAGWLASEEDRKRLWVRATGLLLPEEFTFGRGVWSQPEAQLWFPAGAGVLHLKLCAPRPSAPVLELLARGKALVAPAEVGPEPVVVDIPIGSEHVARGGLDLTMRATAFCPAREGLGNDTRELGVVLTHARFEPSAS